MYLVRVRDRRERHETTTLGLASGAVHDDLDVRDLADPSTLRSIRTMFGFVTLAPANDQFRNKRDL